MLNATELQEIKSALAGVGLNDTEVAVYQTALHLGPRPASVIAKRVGLKRTRAYDVLESLKRKGVVRELLRNKVKHFSSCPPEHLIELLESEETRIARDKQKLRDLLPVMQRSIRDNKSGLHIEALYGSEAIHRIYEDMLKVKQPIYGFVRNGRVIGLEDADVDCFMSSFNKKRCERAISAYLVMMTQEADTRHPECVTNQYCEICELEEIALPIDMLSYGSKVAIFYDDKRAVWFDSLEIASTIFSLHQVMWRKAA